MSKIKIIELFSLIRKNRIAFFSICFFVILAAGLFLGIGGTMASAENTVYAYLENQHFHDLEVLLPYGITDEELAALKNVEGVDAAEASPVSYEFFNIGSELYQAKVSVGTESVDILSLREGRLAEKAGEIVVEKTWADKHNIHVGDTITFNADYTGSMDLLTAVAEYKGLDKDEIITLLTNLKNHPEMEYLTTSEYVVTGLAESPVYIMPGGAQEDSVTNGKPIDVLMYVASDSFRSDLYSVNNRVLIFSSALRGYEYGSAKYAELATVLKERVLKALSPIYEEKNATLTANRTEISRVVEILVYCADKISAGDTDAAVGLIEKLQSWGIDLPSAAEIISKLDETGIRYDELKEKIETLANTDIGSYSATALTRDYTANYHVLAISNNILANMRLCLAGTFLFIGLLVCFSAISRFVKQQTKLIGTKKALGMRKREIYQTFLNFTGLSVLIGCILGAVAVSPLLQLIMLGTMAKNYNIGSFGVTFLPVPALIVTAVILAVLLGVTFLAVRKTLNHPAIDLLNGPEPPAHKQHFYEKLPGWKHLSLLGKTIVNNCTTDVMRVLATIISIAGATALVVLSLTLHNNMNASVEVTLNDYFHFDTLVMTDTSDEKTVSEIKAVLEKYGASGTPVYWKNTAVQPAKDQLTCLRLIVTQDPDGFSDFVTIYDSDTGKLLDTSHGFYCCEAVKTSYGDSAKTLRVSDKVGNFYDTNVNAFFRSYLCSGFMFMDADTYADIYGSLPSTNALLVNTKNVTDLEGLKAALSEISGYGGMSDFEATSRYAFKVMMNLAKVMVAVYLVIALIMSVLVLLNLLDQLIMEKKKELIVLRINGYSVKEARRYVYTDTIFLCAVSVILGAVLGSLIGNIAVSSFDVQCVHLLRRVDFIAIGIGMAVSCLLTFLMSKKSLKQVDKLHLTDVNS